MATLNFTALQKVKERLRHIGDVLPDECFSKHRPDIVPEEKDILNRYGKFLASKIVRTEIDSTCFALLMVEAVWSRKIHPQVQLGILSFLTDIAQAACAEQPEFAQEVRTNFAFFLEEV